MSNYMELGCTNTEAHPWELLINKKKEEEEEA